MSTANWADWMAFASDVAQSADLNQDVRKAVDIDLAVGNAEWAVFDALLGTQSALPIPILNKIKIDVLPLGWYGPDDRKLVIDALDRQLRQHAA